ncbi:MAG: class 1 fructose-bisphosphatase [Chloroflexi bacterium]|nr:class 1 fructose-bisphosphatase [Chloroflexota bacterium]
MAKLITIERHILEEQQAHFPEATGTFTNLMYDIALVAKQITHLTSRAGLANILGAAGDVNVQGEQQQKLDVYADDLIYRMMDHTGRLCIMGSEERPEPLHIPDKYPTGPYALLYDPLDGSSNIDYNVSIGTIFSIHRRVSTGDRGTIDDLLQPGYKMVAAGYTIYGSSTMLVYSAGIGVHGFTLDPNIGEFLLSHPNIRIPSKPKYYSINHGYTAYWHDGVRQYGQWLTQPERNLSLRYIGSMVVDFHRTLLSGGVFAYPADTRDPDKPFGKLRLNYECAPLAFVAEQAGGYASDGVGPILNIQPQDIHQRVPFFVGNRDLVEKAEEFIDQHDTEWVERYMSEVQHVVPA